MESRIAREGKNCEVHGIPMVRKLEVPLDPYPLDATGAFQKKRRQLFYNDGTTFMGCGYQPRELTWTCARCSEISLRERKRRGITE
jgi:hypothetical protein